jgi:hypothetical protein
MRQQLAFADNNTGKMRTRFFGFAQTQGPPTDEIFLAEEITVVGWQKC